MEVAENEAGTSKSLEAHEEACPAPSEGTSSRDGHITPREQNGGFQKDLASHTSGGCLKEELVEMIIGSNHGSSFNNVPCDEFSQGGKRKDDDHLYCEECGTYYYNKCEVHGPALFIPDTPVPMGVEDRARQTLPPCLEVRMSNIAGAGLGVFNMGEIVPIGAHFGPYQGELVKREEAMNSGYSWVLLKNSQCEEYIDASRETHANWMRYVNCARNKEEQNLLAFQFRGGILYRCCRPIELGQELLVWYEDDYAKVTRITLEYLWNKKCPVKENKDAVSREFSCSLCPISYTAEIYLHKHIWRWHHEEYLRLQRSGEIKNDLTSRSSGGHQQASGSLCVKVSRGQTRERNFVCSQCGKSFPHQTALQTHQRIHTGEKPYQCLRCGRCFRHPNTLNDHRRTHTGEKPYTCSQCGKSFAQQGSLKQHQRIHTGEKPYRCVQCGKSFTQPSNYQQHLRIHTGEKLYTCSQCGKSFTHQSTLRQHQLVHDGVKPHQCSQCGKSFFHKSYLKLHLRDHTGEKPYQCSQCGKKFTRQTSLQTHQRIHTGEKPYHCSHCGKRYTRQTTLHRHQRNHMGEEP